MWISYFSIRRKPLRPASAWTSEAIRKTDKQEIIQRKQKGVVKGLELCTCPRRRIQRWLRANIRVSGRDRRLRKFSWNFAQQWTTSTQCTSSVRKCNLNKVIKVRIKMPSKMARVCFQKSDRDKDWWAFWKKANFEIASFARSSRNGMEQGLFCSEIFAY